MIKNKILKIESKEYLEFRDISDEVIDFFKKNKVKDGQMLIYSKHTTLAICINEKEKGIFNDFRKLMDKLIPKNGYYEHNDLTKRTENLVCQSGPSDCLNGHSHCNHFIMRNSETIPIIDSELVLGPWQKILAIELDCGRKREIVLQIMGE